MRAVRKGPWKLVYPHTFLVPEPPGVDGIHGQYGRRTIEKSLFHLETDVGETRNLLAHYPEVARELEALGEKARQDLGDGEREGANRRPAGKLSN